MTIKIGKDISVASGGYDSLVLSTTDACDSNGVIFRREAHLVLSPEQAIELATALLVTVAAVKLADSKAVFPEPSTARAAIDAALAAARLQSGARRPAPWEDA